MCHGQEYDPGFGPGRIWRALSYKLKRQGVGFVGEGFWPSYEFDDAVSPGFVLTKWPLIFPRLRGKYREAGMGASRKAGA